MEVVTKEPIQVPLKDIVFDESNPNRMRPEQVESLKASLTKYGNVHPIVLDESSNMVADGFHRVLAYQQMGMETIPAIKVRFESDEERKLCRQVMNKLHGMHDPDKDLNELKMLMQYDEQQMHELLLIDQKYMEEMERLNKEMQQNFSGSVTSTRILDDSEEDQKAGFEQGVDQNPMPHYADSYLQGNIKQITIYFSNEEYKEFFPRVQNAMIDLNVGNATSMFIALMDFYEKWRDNIPK